MPSPLPHPGQQLHGFTVTAVTPLPELNLSAVQLRHERTGARHLHIACSDDNNLFAVTFRTPPRDSTGIAHILEHTVLCGSQHFPVRDPFFAMLKRSLSTFMNAMTASDWTMYPFSSCNRQDFANLLDIYLDAAFFPLLRERDFRQEGHRLEFADPSDPQTPLTIKGVVYNEMKGAMASPSSLLSRRLNRALYPITTYGHNSGGEPNEIPQLTHAALQAFHAEYYHPSNAWFFTYGDLPLEGHLAVIEEKVLRHFSARAVASAVPLEPLLAAPQAATESFPLDPGEETTAKTMVQVGWLTGDICDSYQRLALSLLSGLLLGTPAAPLYRALLESRLGNNLAPGTGFQDDNRTTLFAAGLQGTEPQHAAAIEQLVLDTLAAVARKGFPAERVEAALHRLEFSHREVVGNHTPYPLNLLLRLVGPWLHAEDPISPLRLDQDLARLRREVADGDFFARLIRRHLLDNPHRVRLTLAPDPELQQREEAALQEQLATRKAQLDAATCARLVAEAQELQQAQEEVEDLRVLPTLTPADIPREERVVVPASSDAGDWFDQPTNGIGYFIAHLPTAGLPEVARPLLPIFGALLPQVGAAGSGWQALAERIEAGTGGIAAGIEILEDPHALGPFTASFELRGKALARKQPELFAILGDLCRAADFSDLERLRTVIGQVRASMENSIPGSGHSYAARAAAAGLTPVGACREEWAGLTQLRTIRALAEADENRLRELSSTLEQMARQLFAGVPVWGVTIEADHFATVRPELEGFLSGFTPGSAAAAAAASPFTPRPQRRGWATSLPVAHVARVVAAVPYTHADAAPLAVLAKLLRAGYLHREIREKGGAYGGLAGFDPEGGLFSLLSYRDPHIARTLRVFDDAIAWAATGRFSDEEVDQALLAVFSDLDRPLSPGGRGNREFADRRQGLTPDLRATYRQRLLTVGRSELVRVAADYLGQTQAQSAVAVIAGEDLLRRANADLGSEKLLIERI